MKFFLDLFSWLFVTIYGSFEIASKRPNLYKANWCFVFNNAFCIVYFTYTLQYPYILLNIVFTLIAIRGIRNNRKPSFWLEDRK